MSDCTQHDLDRWSYRASGYELASLCFLLPRQEVGDALVSGEFADACREVADALGCSDSRVLDAIAEMVVYEGRDAEAVLHEVRRDYTRLFVGVVEPPITPYVGVWDALSRGAAPILAVGCESMAIERFMRRCGVAKDLSAGQINEPMDHVGTICEFLEYLCLVNACAVVPASSADVREGDYGKFLEEHFRDYSQWLSCMVDELDASALYLAVANLLAWIANAQ